MKIKQLDHLVLTVKDLEATIRFYETVLGMEKQSFGEGRIALKFGEQKINLHEYGNEFEPKAHLAVPGSEDLCFITDQGIAEIIKQVQKAGIEIIEGPVKRTGANGPIESIYIRDPDLNLIELARYS